MTETGADHLPLNPLRRTTHLPQESRSPGFLNRIATHLLAFEGDSHVEWFQGNYEDYEADLKRRKGVDADQPHRLKFKPLTR